MITSKNLDNELKIKDLSNLYINLKKISTYSCDNIIWKSKNVPSGKYILLNNTIAFCYNTKDKVIYLRSIYQLNHPSYKTKQDEIILYYFKAKNFSRNKILENLYYKNKKYEINFQNCDLFLKFITTNKTIQKDLRINIHNIQLKYSKLVK